jgi:hypothetical protein
MTTEERLEKLEKELTRAKHRSCWLPLVSGVAALAIVFAWTALKTQAQVIHAKGFILESEDGRKCAELSANKAWTGLVLNDKTGEVVRTKLLVYDDESELQLCDKSGEARTTLVVDERQSQLRLCDRTGTACMYLYMDEDGSRLQLCDKKGRPTAELRARNNGPQLVFRDEKERGRVMLLTSKDGSAFWLVDENGNGRVAMSEGADAPQLTLSDDKGTPRAVFGVQTIKTKDGTEIRYPESSILLYDADGKVSWTTP